jgi:hypothetical protein
MLTKVCTKCGVEKTVDCFAKQKRGRYGVRAKCKVCGNQTSAQYHKANRASIAERNKDRRDVQKEAIAEQRKVYDKNNRHVNTARSARRRAAKMQATPSWSNKEHIESLYLITAINREGGYDMHVDHIVPLQSDTVCGLHCEANLQLLPASDNISKGNRHWPDMW